MADAWQELFAYCEATYGLYLDVQRGAIEHSMTIERLVGENMQTYSKTREAVLAGNFTHGKGPPSQGGLPLHVSTVGETIDRLKPGGPNAKFLGSMCVVSIFSFWEHRTRPSIAAAAGVGVEDVAADLFGDLCHFRNLILHNHGIADARIKRCKTLKWFNVGDEIVVTGERLYAIMIHLRQLQWASTVMLAEEAARTV